MEQQCSTLFNYLHILVSCVDGTCLEMQSTWVLIMKKDVMYNGSGDTCAVFLEFYHQGLFPLDSILKY